MSNHMKHFMEYHGMGSVLRVQMKPGCVPTKLDCQSNRRKRTAHSILQSHIVKKPTNKSVKDYEKELERNSKHEKLDEIPSESPVLHADMNIVQEDKRDKAIQVHRTYNFRSKATQSKCQLVNKHTSNTKVNEKSVSTLPFRVTKCLKPSTPSLHKISRKISKNMYSDTERSFTSSMMQMELSSPSISGETRSISDNSDKDNAKENASQILKCTLLKRVQHPFLYIGVPKDQYNIIGLIAKHTNTEVSHILMCLEKIRLDDSFRRLALSYAITPTYCSEIFSKTIPFIAKLMRPFIVELNIESIKRNLPIAFRHKYYDVSCIIDCLEIEVQKPKKALHQSLLWSEYKAYTIKYLVACTPNGLVNYISPGYGGKITDTRLLEECDFIKHLQPGMCVMVDKGFKHVEPYLNRHSVKLVRLPTALSGTKLSKTEVLLNYQIASLRKHVERLIHRLREFKMLRLHACINHYLLKFIDNILIIVCGLINLQDSLIK